MKLLTTQQLEKLTTKRLLAYKGALMKVPETPNWDEPDARLNKSSDEWQTAYAELKAVLSTRENID